MNTHKSNTLIATDCFFYKFLLQYTGGLNFILIEC